MTRPSHTHISAANPETALLEQQKGVNGTAKAVGQLNYRPTAFTTNLKVLVQVVAQYLRTAGMAQFGHRLRFDLADPLARYAINLANFVQRLGLAIGKSKSHGYNAGFPL